MHVLLIIAIISVVISGAVTFMSIQTTTPNQQSSNTDQSTNSEPLQSNIPPAQTVVGGVVKVTIP